jgi:DNA topoisomerase VI subunit B
LCSEEVSQRRLNDIRGVKNHDRIDEELYQDYETEADRKKRLAREAKDSEKLDKLAAKVNSCPKCRRAL